MIIFVFETLGSHKNNNKNREKPKTNIWEKRLWWWDSNPEHVGDFHEQEDIKLTK